MNKVWKVIITLAILSVVFYTNYSGHNNQMPQHVDSWQVVTKADFVIKEKEISLREPFAGSTVSYPPGSHLSYAVISLITGIDMIKLAEILPVIFYIILALLIYALSNILLKNDLASLCIMAFTPLAFTNITILGPFYLVPVTWGILISLMFFYFLTSGNWFFSFIIFGVVTATHISSTAFSMLGAALFFIFNRKYWSKISYLFLFIIVGIIIFSLISSYSALFSLITQFFTFQKSRPYIFFYFLFPSVLLIMLGIGYYLILIREKKAAKFLIPLFTALALNAFLYWRWQGFFLVYRRLFTFTFMMTAFFVGYAVYAIAEAINSVTKNREIRPLHLPLIVLLIALVPMAIETNLSMRSKSIAYVDNAEHILLTEFGKEYPNTYLATNHLQAFALPYYNLKPIQLSPMHGINVMYFNQLSPCFRYMHPECFGDFFYSYNYSYLYPRMRLNVTYLDEFFEREGKVIYEFNREEYRDYVNRTHNVTI